MKTFTETQDHVIGSLKKYGFRVVKRDSAFSIFQGKRFIMQAKSIDDVVWFADGFLCGVEYAARLIQPKH